MMFASTVVNGHSARAVHRKRGSRAGAWLCRLFLVLAVAGCSPPQTRGDLTEAERREDLAFLSTEFAARERSFTPETRRAFEARSPRELVRLQETSEPTSPSSHVSDLDPAVERTQSQESGSIGSRV